MPRTPVLHIKGIHPDDYAELQRQALEAGVKVHEWARFLLLTQLRVSPLAETATTHRPLGDDKPVC